MRKNRFTERLSPSGEIGKKKADECYITLKEGETGPLTYKEHENNVLFLDFKQQ